VRLWDDETEEYIDGEAGLVVVDTSCIRREKNGTNSINREKCKLFIKYHSEQIDFVWHVKVSRYEQPQCVRISDSNIWNWYLFH